MRINKWLKRNTSSLVGKRVAITGSTGGLGRELCRYLLSLGSSLVLIDRNKVKQCSLAFDLKALYPNADIILLSADLEDISSVKAVTRTLIEIGIDVFIHNAGAYSIPRCKTSLGFDNVFQINFVSPYYMIRELLPYLNYKDGRVIVVGSIAHNYSKTDKNDVDFSTRKKASLVYGNAKRYLMYSLYPLFDNTPALLAVTHPGITFTGITAHYPKLIFAIIKHPMKVIFMKPRRAALSILRGLFESTDKNEWIGPRILGIWGLPKKSVLKTCDESEAARIAAQADEIYRSVGSI